MEQQSSKILHSFFVYLPVILIVSLIILIYLTYLITYVVVLINTPEDLNPEMDPFIFIHTLDPSSAYSKGLGLFIASFFLVVMLLLCLLRTVFMNPGFHPSPNEVERKIIMKNAILKKEKNKLDEEKGMMTDLPSENEHLISEQFHFLSNFSKMLKEAPLTNGENIEIREKVSLIFSSAQNFPEIGVKSFSNEDIIERNKCKYMAKYREELRESSCCYLKTNLPSSESVFLDVYSGLDLTKLPLCGTCLRLKVERSHHCRHCGKCVLKMDHHCPWLANCIGFRNYKSFCLLHFYGSLSSLLITVTYWEVLVNYNLDYQTNLFQVYFTIFIYCCNLGLMTFLFWLFGVNCNLLFKGQTIIEQSDRERFLSKSTNIYDMGWRRNFTNVFGTNPFVWFIPFFANYKGKGFIFESNGFVINSN